MGRLLATFVTALLAITLGAAPLFAQDEPGEEQKTEEAEAIRFSVVLSGMPGAGKAEGEAGEFEYQEGEYLIATGGVKVKYQDLQLKADRARIDIATNLLTAEGNVVLDEGPNRLAGATLEYDLETRTGRMTDAVAFVSDPGLVITGDEIAKVGERTYSAVDGVFTSCQDQEVPDWSLRMSSAEVTVEGYARVKNARMRFRNVPVFYFPYILWPAKTDRASGLLVPKPGYSSRRGAYLGLAYYQTLGRSADTTFFVDLFSEEYFGVGNEIRYRPNENTRGNFRAHLITEPDLADRDPNFDQIAVDDAGNIIFDNRIDRNWTPGDDRWKVQYFHESNQLFGGKFRGVIAFEDYSDFDYLQDYERDVDQNTRSVIQSQAYLTANFGLSSLNIQAQQSERIGRAIADPEDPTNTVSIVNALRQLPEIEYRLRNLRLGNTPMYLSLLSSAHYLEVDNSDDPRFPSKVDFFRADFFPTLSIPLSTLPWLSTKVDLSYRATWYSESGIERPDQLAPGAEPAEFFEGGSLTRSYPQAEVEIIGPSFSKIFEKKIGRFDKFKHIVEPRIEYLFIDDIDDTLTTQDDPLARTSRIIQFDEVDRVFPSNFAVFSVTNRILAKPAAKRKPPTDVEPAVEEAEAEIPPEGEEQIAEADEEGEEKTEEELEEEVEDTVAYEILSFELAQAYSFDADQPGQISRDGTMSTREGPLVASLRLNPSQWTSFKADVAYNTLFDEVQSYAFSGGTKIGRHAIGLTWRADRNVERMETTNEQAQLYTTLGLWRDQVALSSYVSFDIDTSELLQQRHVLTWKGRCLSFDLEYRETKFPGRQNAAGVPIIDRDYRFSLTLRNVGTFLDFSGSLSSY